MRRLLRPLDRMPGVRSVLPLTLLLAAAGTAASQIPVEEGIYQLLPIAAENRPDGFPSVELFAVAPIWGLDEAVLVVDANPSVAPMLAIDVELLEGLVSQYLEERGVHLLPADQLAATKGTTMISLELNADTIEGSGRIAFAVGLAVKQLCVPVAEPEVATIATVWRTSQLGMTQGEAEFRARSLGQGVESCLIELLQVRDELARRRAALTQPAPSGEEAR
ncbi:MAG: hypothetical protein H6831_08050 [Planctomycetes bacterium]|nr:hypothetical protein [Planctomycetota bacterium]MCB9904343.1 hypothetical protein [Planctomycetota bacterium]